MQFLIVPMRKRGVARSKRDIANAEPVTGDIFLQRAKRTANTASLRHGAWPGDEPPLRPLLDARLTSMATLGFTLSGLEEVDGVLIEAPIKRVGWRDMWPLQLSATWGST